MNTLHASFIARIYEILGLNERKLVSAQEILPNLESEGSEFKQAYLYRPLPTSWQ